MYDFKWIKENRLEFEEGLNKRGTKIDSNLIIELYDKYVKNISNLQDLQNSRNKASKNIGIKKASGQDASKEINEVSKLKIEISKLQDETDVQFHNIKSMVEVIPNVPFADVPIGDNEKYNQVIKSYGKKEIFLLHQNLMMS